MSLSLPTPRRRYLDWLRGIGVLIMIEGHTIDSWTRAADRDRLSFEYALILAGFGAPVFLFLAGIAIPLAAGAHLRRGASVEEAASATRARGWRILGLAFLFRLQSLVLSGGALITLLTVDILNVMGLAMVGASTLWGLARREWIRVAWLAGAAAAAAMVTPLVRAAPWLAIVPDPLEWYWRPFPGRTTFTLLPWAGFLFAGGAVGVLVDRARSEPTERRLIVWLAISGLVMALASYAASFLPAIYAQTNFWTSSPTFFFLRIGGLLTLVPIAYLLNRTFPRLSAPLEYLGRASLFVYWIHVEMVYGVISSPLHRRLSFEHTVVAFVLFSAFLFLVVKLKERVARPLAPRPSFL